MRKLATAVVLAALVAGVIASVAYAEPKSLLGKVLGAWSKKPGKILGIRRDMNNVLTIVMLRGDEVRAYENAPRKKQVTREPALEYDLEKLKALPGGDAGWAHKKAVESDVLAESFHVIRCVRLVEREDGSMAWNVYLYSYTGNFRGAVVVDAKTWEVAPEIVGPENVTNPNEETWLKEEEEEESEE